MAPKFNPTESALLSIRNTISNYSIALDTKSFDLLHSVFSKDMVADYSAVSPKNPTISGLDDFMERIKRILDGRKTQHALSTQRLTFEEQNDGGGVVCLAMTYFTANTFVTGDEGVLDHVSVYGWYDDRLVEVEEGEWRIVHRKVNTFVSFTVLYFELLLTNLIAPEGKEQLYNCPESWLLKR
jgi:hypothetical protein